jgi:NADH-quinone oxidoreductase subunit C
MSAENTTHGEEGAEVQSPGALPAHPALQSLADAFPDARFGVSAGQDVVRVARHDLVRFVSACRENGFAAFRDLCAVDYLRRDIGRFEVAVNLLSTAESLRLRVLVAIPGDDPSLPSIAAVYPGANYYEREAYDLFGLAFEGHPDLTRILLPDDWEGHPLRKDHPVGAVPVQFKGANTVT